MQVKTEQKEIFKDIPGFEGKYQASTHGRIFNKNRDEFATLKSRRTEYFDVKLNGINYSVSRIVATTFLKLDINNKKILVDHINKIRTDNNLSNLRLVNVLQNSMNVDKSKSKQYTSKYKGISYCTTRNSKNKWKASFRFEKENYTKYFDDEKRAVEYYNKEIVRVVKEHAVINKWDGYSEIKKESVEIEFKEDDEKWVNTFVSDDYMVSNYGQFYSLIKDKIIGKNPKLPSIGLMINGKQKNFIKHRLVYFSFNPKGDMKKDVDHINRNHKDNRLCNLRLATKSQNNRNIAKYKNKTSKYKGVCYRKETNRWRAMIYLHGKQTELGSFISEKNAARAYNKALENLGKEHSEFGIFNEISDDEDE
jgi:hypothetical protein